MSAAIGLLNEMAQRVDPQGRSRYPGRIVRKPNIVEVEYNDHDGYGPYIVTEWLVDLERVEES